MIGVIIQARIGSIRLPKKVIKKIEGKTVLEHVVNRVRGIKNSYKIVIATTDKKEDNVLERIAQKLKVAVFRGSKNDVLDRFYQAAKLFKIDPIVRITADCPLLDPQVAEKVIALYAKGDCDYVSNVHPPTFPDGMDVEVFSFQLLEKSWQEAKLPFEREHVTSYIVKNPKIFRLKNVVYDKDFSNLRLTLDEKEDLILIRKIYKELFSQNTFFGLDDIIKLLKNKPELMKINEKFTRNKGFLNY